MSRFSKLFLNAALLLPILTACQAMTPGGFSAKGGSDHSSLSDSPSGPSSPSPTDPFPDAGKTSAAEPGPSVPDSHTAIEPVTAAPPSGGDPRKTYAWGPEATMPPKSDPDFMQWCLVDGKWVPCFLPETPETRPAPYDPAKEREPEAFRLLLGTHPFNTQENFPLPEFYDVFEDQNGFMVNETFVIQVGATFPKPDGTGVFSWWDIIRGPTLRTLITPKGQPLSNSTYVDGPVAYRNTTAGNSNTGISRDVHEGDTFTFYLYYEKDANGDFKAPPDLNPAFWSEDKAAAFSPGGYDAFVGDKKHVFKLGSFVVRDGNARMMIAPGRPNPLRDQIDSFKAIKK